MLRLITIALTALALAAGAGDATGAPADEPAPSTMGPAGSDLPRLPARLSDGSQIKLPPIVVQTEPQRPTGDRRTAYIGAGLVVFALVFWWNRRRRERFEREDAGDASPRPRRRRAAVRDGIAGADRDSDHDADDLRAAARGDRAEPEPRTSSEPPER